MTEKQKEARRKELLEVMEYCQSNLGKYLYESPQEYGWESALQYAAKGYAAYEEFQKL